MAEENVKQSSNKASSEAKDRYVGAQGPSKSAPIKFTIEEKKGIHVEELKAESKSVPRVQSEAEKKRPADEVSGGKAVGPGKSVVPGAKEKEALVSEPKCPAEDVPGGKAVAASKQGGWAAAVNPGEAAVEFPGKKSPADDGFGHTVPIYEDSKDEGQPDPVVFEDSEKEFEEKNFSQKEDSENGFEGVWATDPVKRDLTGETNSTKPVAVPGGVAEVKLGALGWTTAQASNPTGAPWFAIYERYSQTVLKLLPGVLRIADPDKKFWKDEDMTKINSDIANIMVTSHAVYQNVWALNNGLGNLTQHTITPIISKLGPKKTRPVFEKVASQIC